MTDQQDQQDPEMKLREYTYDDLLEYMKEWAVENDMDADMMRGIVELGTGTYNNTYTAYSLAMQAYSNFQDSQPKED